jgi:hypothetical protein
MKDAPTRVRKGDDHMKLRNLALAAAALALPSAAIIAGSAPSDAVTTSVTFAGTLTGNLKGSITITPAITNTASTVPIKFATHTTDSNLVASKGLTQMGVTITGAKGSSVVMAPTGTSCGTLASGLPSGVITTKYTTTGVTTATATHFKPGSTTTSLGPPITATLGGTGTTTTGSFKNGTAGSAASTAKLIIDQTLAQLTASCGSSTGLSKITFTGVNGASTFTFG